MLNGSIGDRSAGEPLTGDGFSLDGGFLSSVVTPTPTLTPVPTQPPSGGGGGGSSPPRIEFRPDVFSFEYTKGTAPPEPQIIRIWNSARGGTLRFSASSDVDWLEFDPFEEISSDDDDKEDIEISIDVDDLEVGTFEAVLTIEARRARNNPQTALVTLIVLGRPSIFLSRQEISFRGVAGAASPPSEIVELSNIGLQSLVWTAETDEPWLLVNPESGVLEQAVAPATISIFADLAGLDPGRHLASLIVSDPKADNDPQTISVEIILVAPTPTPTATSVPVVAFVAAPAAPTPLPIPTSTPSPTPSPTSTATATPTQTATQVPSLVPTSTPTASPTPEPTLTPTPFIPSTELLVRSEGSGILRVLGGPIGAVVVGLFGVGIVGYAVREIFFT